MIKMFPLQNQIGKPLYIAGYITIRKNENKLTLTLTRDTCNQQSDIKRRLPSKRVWLKVIL